jgi:hypothetical protein
MSQSHNNDVVLSLARPSNIVLSPVVPIVPRLRKSVSADLASATRGLLGLEGVKASRPPAQNRSKPLYQIIWHSSTSAKKTYNDSIWI